MRPRECIVPTRQPNTSALVLDKALVGEPFDGASERVIKRCVNHPEFADRGRRIESMAVEKGSQHLEADRSVSRDQPGCCGERI